MSRVVLLLCCLMPIAVGVRAQTASGTLATPKVVVTRMGAIEPANASLRVLHWWTSASEQRAAAVLAAALQTRGILWQDEAIPGGAGVGAGKVLRGRVLAGTAPEVTQIVGTSIAQWASLGLLLEFDDVARRNDWDHALLDPIDRLIRYRGHVVAAPLGVHRVNWLLYNRHLFERLHLSPPTDWTSFEQVARALRDAGVVPLAQSAEPWQIATLFENLVLAQGGRDLYLDLFVRHDDRAIDDPRLAAALVRLRAMRAWMEQPLRERAWVDVIRDLAQERAGMMVMGDWAKAELATMAGPGAVGCIPVPGTAAWHLYSVDTLTMFANDYSHAAAQATLAALTMDPGVQLRYNRAKGSVPVRRDIDPAQLDACAAASWRAFAADPGRQIPSLVHRMATDDASKDAIIAEVDRFFRDVDVSPAQMQRRLVAVFRAMASPAVGPARDSDTLLPR